LVKKFDDWLTDVITNPKYTSEERISLLTQFETKCDVGKLAHPRSEHFVPIFVAAGAVGGKQGVKIYDLLTKNIKEFSLASFLFQ